jgi:hypothetical protein
MNLTRKRAALLSALYLHRVAAESAEANIGKRDSPGAPRMTETDWQKHDARYTRHAESERYVILVLNAALTILEGPVAGGLE